MSLKFIGPIKARCQYCTAWDHDQLPDEHYHTIKLDYDNTCDIISFFLDGKVLFVIDLVDWQKIHKGLDDLI